jgi:hypothetical protein
MKKTTILIIVLLVLVAGFYVFTMDETTREGGRVGDLQPEASAELNPETFSGTLTEVNTACFADGECYVVVDGKHVTTTIGWSQETVGKIEGVESFGDLESQIGKEVEVYASNKGDGSYTLYGSEDFYVRLK